jgi:hypothetical protein
MLTTEIHVLVFLYLPMLGVSNLWTYFGPISLQIHFLRLLKSMFFLNRFVKEEIRSCPLEQKCNKQQITNIEFLGCFLHLSFFLYLPLAFKLSIHNKQQFIYMTPELAQDTPSQLSRPCHGES